MTKKLPLLLLILLALARTAHAQEDINQSVAVPVPIEGEVADGDLICAKTTGFGLCDEEYIASMYGVVNTSPSVVFEVTPAEGLYPVLTFGKAFVKVSAVNGAIAEGDFLTSSKTAGVAMKATQNGYGLGKALEAYDPGNASDVGKIAVMINIAPTIQLVSAGQNLLAILTKGLSLASLDALSYLRYLLAAMVVIVSFLLGFIYFGRVIRTGVESMGRNPLAARAIQLSVLFNIFILIVIIGVGLAVAYFILVL